MLFYDSIRNQKYTPSPTRRATVELSRDEMDHLANRLADLVEERIKEVRSKKPSSINFDGILNGVIQENEVPPEYRLAVKGATGEVLFERKNAKNFTPTEPAQVQPMISSPLRERGILDHWDPDDGDDD